MKVFERDKNEVLNWDGIGWRRHIGGFYKKHGKT